MHIAYTTNKFLYTAAQKGIDISPSMNGNCRKSTIICIMHFPANLTIRTQCGTYINLYILYKAVQKNRIH